MANKRIKYYLSAGNWGDGKSVCLWRDNGLEHSKIARFQSDMAALQFVEEFGFPLSDSLKERLHGKQ